MFILFSGRGFGIVLSFSVVEFFKMCLWIFTSWFFRVWIEFVESEFLGLGLGICILWSFWEMLMFIKIWELFGYGFFFCFFIGGVVEKRGS